MIAFYHHSRRLAYRTPQGASAAGKTVRLFADAALPEGTRVFVRLWEEGRSETLVPMTLANGRAEAALAMPDAPCLVWYFFVLRLPDGHTLYYGGASGEGMFVKHEPPAWQITVYDGAFATPRAFSEGIVYQIFPDRFRRSSWEDFRTRAGAHLALGRRVRFHDRWSDAPEHLPAPGDGDYAPNDFFGGDLNGIREKLPYLRSLGVTWLYLNPVFESESNHRYNTADYRRIDPILGDEADFRRLAAEARALGMRILLDGVFSHTGSDSRYFNREGRYPEPGAYQGPDSPYYEWYSFRAFPDDYECWWEFSTLPNVREMTPSYRDFIAGERGVLAYWADAGATSWRLDVADELPDTFIRLLRKRVKALDPEGVLLGEVWEDCSNKFGAEGRRDYVDGDLLDSAMNYPFADAVAAFLTGRCDAAALNDALQTLREHYPKPFHDACLNLLSSHDTVRLQTTLSGAPGRNALSREAQAAYRPAAADAALGRRRVVLAAAMQAAHPGVPCIYYGDEAGMTGMADPFNRGTFPWGSEDVALLESYRRIFTARAENGALKRGRCRMGALDPDVFAIVRFTEDAAAVLLVNRADAERTVTLDMDALAEGPDGETPVHLPGAYRNVLTGAEETLPETLRRTLPPVSATFWIRG